MINVILFSLIFGISQKLADAVNEHGTVLFKGANLIFGMVFAIFGSLLISIDNCFAEFYLGLVLYWLLAGKLDFFNHQLSGSIMLVVALHYFRIFDVHITNIIFVVFIFFLFKIMKKLLYTFNPKVNYTIDKKIHHFIIAIILGIWFSNWLISISIIFTMIGIISTIQVLKQNNNYHNCSF
jgi:hypothetical protein